MAQHNQQNHLFAGFQSPNFTAVPDEVFDSLLADLSGAELKVLLYVIRRTFGFKKGSDRISKGQLAHGIRRSDGTVLDMGTGLSRRAVRLALDNLVGRRILTKHTHTSAERGNESAEFALNVIMSSTTTNPGVQNTPALGRAVPQGLGRAVPPQETVLQETVLSSNIEQDKQGDGDSGENAKREHCSATDGMVTIATVLQGRTPRSSITGDDRQVIQAYMADIGREFNDRATLHASTTRALHLLERSGTNCSEFVGKLFEARALTKESAASGKAPVRNRMAYFFTVLADLLALEPQAASMTPDAPHIALLSDASNHAPGIDAS